MGRGRIIKTGGDREEGLKDAGVSIRGGDRGRDIRVVVC